MDPTMTGARGRGRPATGRRVVAAGARRRVAGGATTATARAVGERKKNLKWL